MPWRRFVREREGVLPVFPPKSEAKKPPLPARRVAPLDVSKGITPLPSYSVAVSLELLCVSGSL